MIRISICFSDSRFHGSTLSSLFSLYLSLSLFVSLSLSLSLSLLHRVIQNRHALSLSLLHRVIQNRHALSLSLTQSYTKQARSLSSPPPPSLSLSLSLSLWSTCLLLKKRCTEHCLSLSLLASLKCTHTYTVSVSIFSLHRGILSRTYLSLYLSIYLSLCFSVCL